MRRFGVLVLSLTIVLFVAASVGRLAADQVYAYNTCKASYWGAAQPCHEEGGICQDEFGNTHDFNYWDAYQLSYGVCNPVYQDKTCKEISSMACLNTTFYEATDAEGNCQGAYCRITQYAGGCKPSP